MLVFWRVRAKFWGCKCDAEWERWLLKGAGIEGWDPVRGLVERGLYSRADVDKIESKVMLDRHSCLKNRGNLQMWKCSWMRPRMSLKVRSKEDTYKVLNRDLE